MSDVAIRVEGLGKKYRLGERERYLALRDILSRSLAAPLRWVRGKPRAAAQDFWALDDVSFEIRTGEMVGIIGRNGAGKSTLLKILSRITYPTKGRAEIRGRVGSLLEVGTGFHPELTGRENLYLSGAILGMRRSEVRRKAEDIIAFSELERFIDTPVKRYSSGMYTRLAFSVAAHLDPEVLLIDEVLAVGDADFQKKCLGRMDEITESGRTVLVVSHNMAVIKAATTRALWLDKGRLREEGESRAVADHYLSSAAPTTHADGEFDADYLEQSRARGWGAHQLKVLHVRLVGQDQRSAGRFREGALIELHLQFEVNETLGAIRMAAPVSTLEGQVVFRLDPGLLEGPFRPGRHEARLRFDSGPLLPGVYRGEIVVESKIPQDRVMNAFDFEIVAEPRDVTDPYQLLYDDASEPTSRRSDRALIRIDNEWSLRPRDVLVGRVHR